MTNRHSCFPRALSSRRASALAVLLALGGASSVAEAAQYPADLTVSLSGPTNVQSGGAVTFYATVRNVAVWGRVCYFDLDLRRRICEPVIASDDAFGVDVHIVLPPGFSPTSASGGDFYCLLGTTVKCSGGTVWADDAVTITVGANAAAVTATTSFTSTATVDPFQIIPERSESNNAASFTLSVTPPPPPPPALPDLWVYEAVTPATFSSWQSVTFDVYVYNLGPAPASNAVVQMFTNLPAGIATWSQGGGFSCSASGGLTQILEFVCRGNLPAYASALLRFELRLANPLATPAGTPFTLYGYLDPANAIPESNEQNNLFTRAAIVQ